MVSTVPIFIFLVNLKCYCTPLIHVFHSNVMVHCVLSCISINATHTDDTSYSCIAVEDISILQCSAQFRILYIIAHYVADNASHSLASSATIKPTFNVEEEVVVIRNGWTPKKGEIAASLSPLYLIHTCM